MSRPSDGLSSAPLQRRKVSRKKRPFRVDFRPDIYAKLQKLSVRGDGRCDSISEVIERLVEKA